MPRGQAAAERALSIDPHMSEAHTTLGMIRSIYHYDWQHGEDSFRESLALNPNYAVGRMWLSLFNLAPRGRLKEARKEASTARDFDPLNPATSTILGGIDYFSRNYEKAVAELRHTLEYDPSFPVARVYLGQTLAVLGQHEEAERQLKTAIELFGNNLSFMGGLARAYGFAGNKTGAQGVLEHLNEAASTRYVPNVAYALAHLGLGENERAIDYVEAAVVERSSQAIWLSVDPMWDVLRGNPRFDAVLARLGFAQQSS
jgi:serine/threonine-protein kinase